jgi:hypothetical protein
MEAFDDTITYAAIDKKARNLRYEKCNSALTYYFQMMELLGKMKITDVPPGWITQGANQTNAFIKP